jgi:hypothetical protein
MPSRFLELTECYQQMLGGDAVPRWETRQTYVRAEDIRMFSAAPKMEVFEDNVDKLPRSEVWIRLAEDRTSQLFVLEPPYLILGWLEQDAAEGT